MEPGTGSVEFVPRHTRARYSCYVAEGHKSAWIIKIPARNAFADTRVLDDVLLLQGRGISLEYDRSGRNSILSVPDVEGDKDNNGTIAYCIVPLSTGYAASRDIEVVFYGRSLLH